MMRVMSSVGSPTEVRTITMVTRPAWGMPAAPMLAAVAVMLYVKDRHVKHWLVSLLQNKFSHSHLMVMIWPKFISMLLTWAIKIAANASYKAVPSMFMVAPTGSTKRVILLSILLFSSRHLKVTGSVAELRNRGTGLQNPSISHCQVHYRKHERQNIKNCPKIIDSKLSQVSH